VKFGIEGERGAVWIGAENVFNERYQENLGYDRPGRTYVAGGKLTF